MPPNPLNAGDIIQVNHLLTLTNALTINGTLTWNTPASTVTLNQNMNGSGTVNITGRIINITSPITLTGTGSQP